MNLVSGAVKFLVGVNAGNMLPVSCASALATHDWLYILLFTVLSMFHFKPPTTHFPESNDRETICLKNVYSDTRNRVRLKHVLRSNVDKQSQAYIYKYNINTIKYAFLFFLKN